MKEILLTGSTGQLGSYILNALVQHPEVTHIWCLNRSDTALSRQEALLRTRGLERPLPLPAYVEFHKADFSASRLGLKQEIYEAISENVTHVVHCAWPVDWNRTFESFEPSIRGVAHLIELAKACPKTPLLFFLSSVAAVGNWGAIPGARETVPEEIVEDFKIARGGYGQSKLVSELLLAEASRTGGLRTAVCRIGQVAGPVDHGANGKWPDHEWVPSLVASSKYLGILPETLGPVENVDWVPVDRLTIILLELLFSVHPTGVTRYHHISNPRTTAWRELVPTVQKRLSAEAETQVALTGLVAWIEALEASSTEDLDCNPAFKLLPFFQSLKDRYVRTPKAKSVTMELKATAKRSSTLKDLEPVGSQSMLLWLQQWGYS